MNAVTSKKTIRFPGIVLSKKVPLALAPHLIEKHDFRSTATLSFFRSVYHYTFTVEGKPMNVFVQLDEHDAIQDMFCQCEPSQGENSCPHMAEAVRSVFSKSSLPLHKRFYESPYYRLLSHHSPFKKIEYSVQGSEVVALLPKGEKVVLKGKYEPFLSAIEVEENMDESSLKFSTLSEEELNEWYQKKPSKRVRFELSFLYDLARFLFLKEEFSGKPTSSIRETHVQFLWDDLEVLLPIPSQGHVAEKECQEGKVYDVVWELAFSEEEGFHQQAFVQKKKGSRFIGENLQTEDGTLYKTGGSFFEDARIHIPVEEVSQFVDEHRPWLSLFPGLDVHDEPFFRSISYVVDTQGALSFFREKKQKQDVLSFEEWVLVPSHGFFLKEMKETSLPLNRTILPHHVAEFIRSHKLELKNVTDFFAKESPVSRAHVHVRQEKCRVICIEPVITWKKKGFEKGLITFDEFGFHPDFGFFELPSILNLAREIKHERKEEWNEFFEQELPHFVQREDCTIDPLLLPPTTLKLMCNKLEPEEVDEAPLAAQQEWEFDFFWQSPLGEASFSEVCQAKRKGEKFLITKAGTLCLHEAKFDWISLLKNGKQKKAKTWDFLKINAHDDVHFTTPLKSGHGEVVDRLLHDSPVEPLPSMRLLASTLRSYQKKGLEWLWMLYSFGLSGLLCDDMGVGKTHQAMALLAVVKEIAKKKVSFLIVCPTSLIWHWREKLESFLPSFSICTYVGSDRSIDDFSSKKQDIFLTTYGIWRNEFASLKNFAFEIAIFDELQIAKNHFSRVWSALSQVNAKMRIGLTGTPIENQLRELKALFDLIVPGYLPEDSLFRALYMKGGDIEPNLLHDRSGALSKYVRPFVLRRRKVDVLQDLPAKVEEKYHVDLLESQNELYRQVASQEGLQLLQQLRNESSPIPYIHIFSLLSSLKQICNHPAAYLKQVEQYEEYESGKWDAFVELLEEAIESDQKVVVFSQFLAMLDIMKLYLTKKGIGFTEIRGRTKDRGEALTSFKNDPDCRVFLGSLQAAGLGIDLTPATVVIHYDRWWNAARENQATDRVHRIGQEHGVQVCKLITRSTIEERIDTMIERKSRLLEDVLAYDDHQVVKKLSRAELLDLLQDLNELKQQ